MTSEFINSIRRKIDQIHYLGKQTFKPTTVSLNHFVWRHLQIIILNVPYLDALHCTEAAEEGKERKQLLWEISVPAAS